MKKKSTHAKSETTHGSDVNCIKEFHLFAGIGGGIYGADCFITNVLGLLKLCLMREGYLRRGKKTGGWIRAWILIAIQILQN